MISRLFRRETSRKLRAIADHVIDDYHSRRFPWLDAYMRPSREQIRGTIEMLAEAVERDDTAHYHGYIERYVDTLLAQDVPPIVMLAAGDLLYETILQFLTPDQQDLVLAVLYVQRGRWQAIVYDRVIGRTEPVGA